MSSFDDESDGVINKRQTIRNFSKIAASKDMADVDWQELLHDRAAALIVAAETENLLEEAIVACLKNKDRELLKMLFEGPNASIGSFSSKINMSYALGIVSKKTKNNLNQMRLVRNGFAHHARKLDFNHHIISEEASIIVLRDETERKIKENFCGGGTLSAVSSKFPAPKIKYIMCWIETIDDISEYYTENAKSIQKQIQISNNETTEIKRRTAIYEKIAELNSKGEKNVFLKLYAYCAKKWYLRRI